ncbi:hypothetical protein ACH4Y0_39450 [Streptomyces sp. NPDC020707]|uniref:Uncharacterized protein n=1 Tax=Streptomyces ortus TaxID=2867268 RepID=A0ABT3V594_9ACTN|nr:MULTISPECIES: hypothetical protein [Streptomyces]MCX4235162.1 hypothetical protein [Streptomyces ortus]
MKEKFVDWADIERLANTLVKMRNSFSEDDRRLLQLVFEAAGDQLTGRREAQYLGTRFRKGSDSRRSQEAVKVNLLYVAQDDGSANGPNGPRGRGWP